MGNRLTEKYIEESKKCGVIGAVSQINAMLIAKSANETKINMREVREFSEYLRDEVFSRRENYSAMMDNWGQEPYVMRLANVSVNAPIGIVDYDKAAGKSDDSDDGLFDDDFFDDDIFDGDFLEEEALSENAEVLFEKLYEISGDITFTLATDEGIASLNVWEEMKGIMSNAIVSFLYDFIYNAGSLTVNFTNPETGTNTVYGFQTDGEDWYPVTKKELRRAYETDSETGEHLPPLPDVVYRELKK